MVPGAAARRGNLREGLIFLAPQRVAPGLIQRLDRAEPLPQSPMELAHALPAIAAAVVSLHPVEQVQLVVDLPAENVQVLTELLSQGRHDPPAQLAVRRAVRARVPPRAVLRAAVVVADENAIGIARVQPHRRRAGRRAKDRGDPRGAELVDHHVQPVEVEAALLRLDAAPGELADPHAAHARLLHQGDVGVDLLERPGFRVVRRA